MALHPLAGKPAPAAVLVDVARLEREFLDRTPDSGDPRQRVKFGTSGHRGTPFDGSLTAAHIAAITQAICDYRRGQGIDGPIYMGKDTHALSALSQDTALEVLAGNDVDTIVQRDNGVTPTPVISRAILTWNQRAHLAPGRWDRHHSIAQPARGRRVQVQPAERRARRHRRDTLDSAARERAAGGEERRRQAGPIRGRAEGVDDASGRSRRPVRR